ncbi:MAG TPA: sugar ABC transporter ATP-binding protein [Abditibacteriaceae bacterium]|jgi:rhamnose transport system ATP-binding protein
MTPLIQIQNLDKAFGNVQALSGVSFDILPGEIHALVGENGAGKSTLIKSLGGAHEPSGGQILVEGQPLMPGVAASEAAGIGIIHQESTAFGDLGAEDNIFVGRELRRVSGLLLDRPQMRRTTQELLNQLGENFDTRCPVGRLSIAQRQMVGFARALLHQNKLLILDEPTASLSERECQALFATLRRLKSAGVASLYVSHRLDEIFALADHVTVLRDGAHVATRDVKEMDKAELIRLMVGRDVLEEYQPRDTVGEAILQVDNLSGGAFRNINFQVRAGEIVGLAGLVGAGRSEVARAIFGIDDYMGGSVKIKGKVLPKNSVQIAATRGLALVPEDRQHQGLILPMSVGENLSLAVLKALSSTLGRNRAKEKSLIQQLMAELAVKAANTDIAAQSLSGGNQQKLVLGKWLATQPKVLILDEPTRGVDVGARAEVYRLIRGLASGGLATLVVSSDLPEILALCDRILVMREGEISGELLRSEATSEKILQLALPKK